MNAAVPAFAIGVKFRHDERRNAWVVLAPERLFLPDEIGVEILKLVDGRRSVDGIVADLVARFADAPADVIAGDVETLLRDLADRGVLRL